MKNYNGNLIVGQSPENIGQTHHKIPGMYILIPSATGVCPPSILNDHYW